MDVLALNKKDTAHLLHVLGQTCQGALGNRNHQRRCTKADQQTEMKLADVIDDAALADSATSDNEDDGTRHRVVRQAQAVNSRSAATSRSSFSRPCEATRMWKRSMPTL